MTQTTLSYFTRLIARLPYEITLNKVVGKIRKNDLIKENTLTARKWYAKGRKGKGDYIKKAKLPAFAPAAILDSGKSPEDVIDLTGICFIDIDHITESDVQQTIQALSDDPHTLLASVSLSGKGVHLLVRYRVDFGDHDYPFISSPEKMGKLYKDVFMNLAGYYSEKLGHQVDMSGDNAERLCLINHDPDVYYNPESAAYIYDIMSNQITNII